MTAIEMFEELGYEEQFKDSDIYRNKKRWFKNCI